MAPLNFIEELIKPFTLALRLFGNIFASGIMIALLGLLPYYALWAPTVVWKLFAMFIGVIQAFIFALLTILYFGMAAEGHGGGGGHEEPHAAEDEPTRPTRHRRAGRPAPTGLTSTTTTSDQYQAPPTEHHPFMAGETGGESQGETWQ